MKNSSTPNKRLNEFQINICGWKEGKKNLIDLFLFIRFPLISEKNENRISLITHNINDVPGTHSIHKMINWVFRFSVVLTVTAMIICCPFRIIHYVIHFNVIIQHFGAWKIITKKRVWYFKLLHCRLYHMHPWHCFSWELCLKRAAVVVFFLFVLNSLRLQVLHWHGSYRSNRSVKGVADVLAWGCFDLWPFVYWISRAQYQINDFNLI